MFKFYKSVYEILSSGLFLFILTSSWTFLFYSILPLGYGFFALPLGLIIGIFTFLIFIKILISIGLIPSLTDQDEMKFREESKKRTGDERLELPEEEDSNELNLDELWLQIDALELDEFARQKLRQSIIKGMKK